MALRSTSSRGSIEECGLYVDGFELAGFDLVRLNQVASGWEIILHYAAVAIC